MRRLVSIAETHVWAFDRWALSIPLYIGDDGQVYVPVRHTCQQLDISVSKQLTRIREDLDIAPGAVEMPEVTPGGLQKVVCLRWREAAWWLATIDASKVRRDIRADLDTVRQALIDYAAALLGGHAPLPALPEPSSARGVLAFSSRDEYLIACVACGARLHVVRVNGETTVSAESE